MDLHIGSNVFRNVNGVLKIDGREQIVLQLSEDGQELFVTMDFYDATGHKIAHLRRNEWGFNTGDRCVIRRSPESASLFTYPLCLTVSDRTTRSVLVEFKLFEKGMVHIQQGTFYSHKGLLVEITSHYWKLSGRPTMFGTVFDVRGGAASIG